VTKTRKGRGTKYQGREKNEEIGFKREERRSEKSDLGVKDGREGREEREGRRFENDQWRWEKQTKQER